MRKLLLLLIVSPLFLAGCIGDLLEFSCEYVEDDHHCYQSVAVQDSDPDGCELVEPEGWPNSNPPKDKCYLLIAENTGDASVCDKIAGGPGSYTREQCIDNVLAKWGTLNASEDSEEDPNDFGAEEEIIEEEEDSTDEGLSNAEKEDIQTITDALTGKYNELLQQDIDLETDPARKAGLEAYQEFLGDMGDKYDEINANFETLSEIRRVFIDSYDPGNDIQHMSVSTELDPGLFDKLSERLFGADPKPTGLERENADAENSLTIYQVMLERQSENDYLQQDRLSRLGQEVSSRFRDKVTGQVVDGAKEVAQDLAGTAFIAVDQVGSAIEAFKDEAQHQMFLGLSRAYNRRREALQRDNPNADPADLHARAVREVKEDPYRDNTQLAFVKHGNILENQDCQDDSNPLCIDDRVFWVAMDKTFRYNNK